MKGHIRIKIQSPKINYDLLIRRNITIIKGNSATGKTSLCTIINNYVNMLEDIRIECDNKCSVLNDANWESCKSSSKNIYFIDETATFLRSTEFGREISKGNDNYFVIISREEKYNGIPYSYKEIYELITENGIVYNTQIYEDNLKSDKFSNKDALIITEDSKMGYEIYKAILGEHIISSHGKNKIYKLLEENINKIGNIVLIVDGAAIGANIGDILTITNKNNKPYYIFSPESFEFMLLHLNIFNDKLDKDILFQPENYIDSKEFSSYERFFYKKLQEIVNNGGCKFSYSKKNINMNYFDKHILDNYKSLLPKELIEDCNDSENIDIIWI